MVEMAGWVCDEYSLVYLYPKNTTPLTMAEHNEQPHCWLHLTACMGTVVSTVSTVRAGRGDWGVGGVTGYLRYMIHPSSIHHSISINVHTQKWKKENGNNTALK